MIVKLHSFLLSENKQERHSRSSERPKACVCDCLCGLSVEFSGVLSGILVV